MWPPHSFIIILAAVMASGAITNKTIDDSDSSFTFTGAWTAITPNSPCDFCSSKPDASQTNGGTWHDGNYHDGAPVGTSGSFTFQGSAVYIFGIDQAISQPNIAFTLGNIQQMHHYTGTEQFVYKTLFFSAEGLDPDQTHTVDWVFSLNPDTGVDVQAALFDYAIVTTGKEDVSPGASVVVKPAQSKSSSGPLSSNASKSRTSSASGTSQSNSASHTQSAQSNSTPSPGDQSSPPSGVQSSPPSTVTEAGGVTTITAQSANSRPKSSNLGAILGAAVGALAVAVLAILFLWYRCRRVRRVVPETDKVARSQFLRIDDFPMQNSPRLAREVSVPASSLKGRNTFELLAASGPSTTSLLSPMYSSSTSIAAGPSIPPPESEPPAINRPTNSAPSRDLRLMEERLATLEAQIRVHQYPPPYIHEDDD